MVYHEQKEQDWREQAAALQKRLDYYDDFTPYIKFAELNNEVIVKFHKNI